MLERIRNEKVAACLKCSMPTFACTSVRVIASLVEMRTRYLPNTSQGVTVSARLLAGTVLYQSYHVAKLIVKNGALSNESLRSEFISSHSRNQLRSVSVQAQAMIFVVLHSTSRGMPGYL
jgi:hypothetical protein